MINKKCFNIIDYGSSKIRFTVFDSNFEKNYSNTFLINPNENYLNHFEKLNKNIISAERQISSHIEDIVLILDSNKAITIDLSLNKNFNNEFDISRVYDVLISEIKQLISNNYSEYNIIHIILTKCIIDNKIYYDLPKKENVLKSIKVEFKIICYPSELITNLKNLFNEKSLNIINIYSTSYIKTLKYLNQLNLDKVSFLEIGFERTTFLFYEKKKLKYIQTIPIGSFNITKDISKVFKISIEDADKIKKLFNKSETEFSYNEIEENEKTSININENISVDKLKQVILYRVQEILDLTFKATKNFSHNLKDTELFLIGEGSILFNNNSFHLSDNFNFRSINFFSETDMEICNAGLIYHINNYEVPSKIKKKQGLFEKFFNFFSK